MRKVFIITGGAFYDVDTKEYHIGGIQTYIRRLVKVLIDCNYSPYILNTGKEKQSAELDNGAYYFQIETQKGDMKSLARKAEEMGDINNDLLLFSTSTEIVPTKYKHVLGIQHGIYWDSNVIRGIKPKNYLSMSVLRSAQAIQQIKWHRSVETLVCVDANYINWLRACSGDFGLKYIYIPNCADEPTKVREKHSDSRLNILFARRFVKHRGIDLLIGALPSILNNYPNVYLTIAGQGEGLSRLHSTFDKFGSRVCFTHFDTMDSVDFHLSYDIAIVPSLYSEGTSLSLLEAMSAGCACIATDIGGLSNIIINGHNGVLIRPIVDDLGKAIRSLLDDNDRREYLGNNAKQTVRDSFSTKIWGDRWKEFLTAYYPPST